ncbi:hypothetical protein PGT21_050003 [Puccinia graminis f. sp. tritici]|uniref:No apical meristem-associated C-terminal domain-containing protein n=1 Tax=Puccinia graminis f. sp. tritici TaxID=56615 RepID=A0A5B0PDH8_PUCGR|nr:hypothetical protein PGTUg99_050090 [Puccinia graminis f. sp. tritici]KAA1099361.1 hypothetical protein PGT21_050003 [Puccinia graminis f. sp. tritici]
MPSKRGANWLPNEDEQLAKSWVKISEDSIQANGQKREEFWNRTAEDFNNFTPGEKRDGIALKYRWTPLQKATLKFSGIYQKITKNQQSGSVIADLLPKAKKTYYEEVGKQFQYELAWMILRNSPKWRESQPKEIQDAPTTSVQPDQTPAPSQSNATGEIESGATAPLASNSSSKRPLGVHSAKRLMKEEHFNNKKVKVLTEHTADYREQTNAMKKSNEIRARVAQAEVSQMNWSIMSKKEDDLPDEISRRYLRLQKEQIVKDLEAQMEQDRLEKEAQLKKQNESKHASDSNPQSPPEDQSESQSLQALPSDPQSIPPSEPEMADPNNDLPESIQSNEEEDLAYLDPSLPYLS